MVAINHRRVKMSRRARGGVYNKEKLSALGLACIGVVYVVWSVFLSTERVPVTSETSTAASNSLRHPNLLVKDPNAEAYNAVALDIIQTLNCHDLLKTSSFDLMMEAEYREGKRKLAEEIQEEQQEFKAGDDDAGMGEFVETNAMHLFCMAALSDTTEIPEEVKSQIKCDATRTRQQTLLDLWSTARGEMDEETLLLTLKVAVETERQFIGSTINLWAPAQDQGVDYMLSVLNNEQKNADHGGIYGLAESLGTNKLFVDVGSCLGLTAMAIARLYPGTKIVSIEPASPSWLLQEINWRCQDVSNPPTLLLAGVGSAGAHMAKFLWRPSSTTSTRSWTPASERDASDIELRVKLRTWHSLLAEAEIANSQIDVVNVDCQGCEYNLIPSLSDAEFEAFKTVMGSIHWGYIPVHKLPSSNRGKETHSRLCRHENFARSAKECCDFPDVNVLSSVPGEVLVAEEEIFPPKAITVKDVAGDLCIDFDKWVKEHHLHTIDNDWGWFQLTSVAD